MKSLKKITLLFCIVAGIVVFWLVPGINKATDVKYTRLYENTDLKKVAADTNHLKFSRIRRAHFESKKPLVIYKRESISSSAKIKDIKPAMFSRSMQFEPERIILTIDSLNEKVVEDSAKLIQ